MLHACFFTQVFTSRLQPPVDLSIERMSWAAMGGPKEAWLRGTGNEAALWEMASLLRSPVEIRDPSGQAVWWGYVEAVRVCSGKIAAETSLESMANRIAVIYAHLPAGVSASGERKSTPWVDDFSSQSAYGIKERLVSLDAAGDEQALRRRDVELARHAYPVPSYSLLDASVEEPFVLVHCRGWWNMYSWRRFYRPAGYIGNEIDSAGVQAVGSSAANGQAAQSFSPQVYSWSAEEVWVRARKTGSPTDSLKLDLASDSGGTPGTELASISVPASAVSGENYVWVGGTLNARVSLAAGTPYWLRIRRTGAAEAGHYYQIDVDEGLHFSGGSLRIFNGSAWTVRSPDADAVFKVLGTEETTTQVINAAIGSFQRDFITKIERHSLSNVYSCPYRDGDDTRLQVITELLQSGTDMGKRLLAIMLNDRVFSIALQPEPGEVDWSIDRTGQIFDERGRPVPVYISPVGHWLRLRQGAIAGVPWGSVSHPLRSFVEEAEYDAGREEARLKFED